ncbi:MAG: helix-turn-helix domain-containing protein [Anaerolineales bacterium]|nr:helix-turn-helix domain-containing protein [Anaerolineales bacterium]
MTTRCTVRELWKLALPLDTRLLAGVLGLERPVRWVRLGGVLSPIFPTLDDDDLALLDLRAVRASNPTLTPARIVRDLSRLGICALGLLGEVDRAAIGEANRANLPLLHLPDDSDLPHLVRAAQRLLRDRETQCEMQAATLYRRLIEGAAAGESVPTLVGHLARWSGAAITLYDREGNLIGQAGDAAQGTDEYTRALKAGENVIGRLTMASHDAQLGDFGALLLEQGAAALAVALAAEEAVQAAQAGGATGVAAAVRADEADAVIQSIARRHGYPLDQWHWAIVVQREAPDEAGLIGWANRVEEEATALGWQWSHHAGDGSDLLLLLAGHGPWGHPHHTFLGYLRETAPDLTIAAGEPAQRLAGLRETVAQAQDALRLGQRLLGSGQTHLHREMGLYRLLRHLHGSDEAADFVQATLGPLQAYDAEHGSALLVTVETLLAQGGNLSATAKALHLHRNSLAYRLDRIRAIGKVDPSAPADAFALRLALLLAPLVERRGAA